MTDSSTKTKDSPYFMVQSVDRALAVLQSFIEERRPMGVTEAAKRLGLHKSVVHRLMLTLQHHGYLEQVRDTEKYMIGPRAFELGAVYTGSTTLVDEGNKMLMQVVEEIGMTAHLGILEGQSVLYLVNVEPDHFKYLFGAVGQRKQIYNTALGKSLTAWLPEEKTVALLADCSFEKKTSTTIASVEEYMQELERVRENGYALDNEEAVVGMRCASAPVRGRMGDVIAAISVSGYNISYERINEIGRKMKGLAAQLSRRLGHYG